MTDEAEKKFRCSEMVKMFSSDAWEFFKAEFSLELAKITALGKKAVDEGKTEAAAYAMAQLSALNRFFIVEESIKKIYSDYLEADKEKDNDEHENH